MKDSEKLKYWQEGIEHFNARRFWHAHESWEHGWLQLPQVEKSHVQCLIQVCGVFDLIKRGRPSASLSLALLAHEKLKKVEELGGIGGIFPRIEAPGLADAISILIRSSEAELPGVVSGISLKAVLLLSPR